MKSDENFLCLDTSMSACSAGVYFNGQIFECVEVMPRGQSERLLPLVTDVMERAGCPFDAVGGVIVTVGPGAFTGVRIALSAARGFGLSLGVPVYGITTLQALGYEVFSRAGEEGRVRVVIDTRRDDYYVQDFLKGKPVDNPALMDAQTAIQGVHECDGITGDACERLLNDCGYAQNIKIYNEISSPKPSVILDFARLYGKETLGAAEPVYLRGADISKPKYEVRSIV